jgi:heme-degrading monooxygenase HmoA
MTIVTVFRSRLRPEVEEEYQEVAGEMSRLAHSMDGFVDEKFYTSSDGERITVVRFTDREHQRAWAEHVDHVRTQHRGRSEFYSWYDISVSEEIYHRSFERESAHGYRDRASREVDGRSPT